MVGPQAHPAAPPCPWVTRGFVWAPGRGRGHHNAPWQAASTRQFACAKQASSTPLPRLAPSRQRQTLRQSCLGYDPIRPRTSCCCSGGLSTGPRLLRSPGSCAPECQFPRCAAETESHESQRLRVIDWPRPCDTFVRMIRPARSRTRNASSTVRPTTRSISWCNPNLSSGKRPTCRPDLQSHGSSTSAGASVLAGLPHLCRTCRVQRRRDLSAGQCWPRDEAQLRFANIRLAAPESRA